MKAILALLLFSTALSAQSTWPAAKANQWYKEQSWITGANFIPSTAVNQLEMWQAETFDPATIQRELGYAAAIGFNMMRVYLHHTAWQEDAAGFKDRIRQYLAIADHYGIKTMFVFLMTAGEISISLVPNLRPNLGYITAAG